MTSELVLGFLIVLSALGVLVCKKPVHSCLSFLLTLLSLAGLYIELAAPFIAAMQILVYAGAILVIFMFVIVLFQDAHLAITQYKAKVKPFWLVSAALFFVATLSFLAAHLQGVAAKSEGTSSVEALGRALYVDFFFPFEAVALLFLVAIIGSLYIGKKVR